MGQQANVSGQGNVTVQIVGDGNAVTVAGAAALSLTQHENRRRVREDIDLLAPYSQSIPIVGREVELASLRAWLASKDEPVSVLGLSGAAGSGKTRLALEFCDRPPSKDWQTGFVEGEELAAFCGEASTASWSWTQPTLVVMDYAATYAAPLHRWLGRLANHTVADAEPLRVLLLERQADTKAGWWRTVFGGGKAGDRAISYLLDKPGPIELDPLTESAKRRDVFAAMLKRVGSTVEPPAPGQDAYFDRRLEELTWGGRPLFLMMAALLAAKEGVGQVLALSHTDLAFRLAERELTRVADAAQTQHLDPAFLEAMVGYVAICQGLRRADLMTAVPREQQHLGLPSGGDPGKVADLLHDLYPGERRGVEPIRPDIIGEAAILLSFDRRYEDSNPVLRAFEQASQRVAAAVIRTAQDFAGQRFDDKEILAPLEWLDALIERNLVDVDQLMMIAGELPLSSLALRQHAAAITETIVGMLRDQVAAGQDARVPSLARMLNNLGVL